MCGGLDDVIVATCDQEILEVVSRAGGKAVMTSEAHERCTDRIAEAAQGVEADVIVNVQGDEPLVTPTMMDDMLASMKEDVGAKSVNLVARIYEEEEFHSPNALKVVANRSGDILYISREPIPTAKTGSNLKNMRFRQLGVIGFRADFLQVFTELEATPLEMAESVDMMRAIEHGFKVKAVKTEGPMIAVDIPEDISRVEAALKGDPLIGSYVNG